MPNDANVGSAEPVRPDSPPAQVARRQDGMPAERRPFQDAVGELLAEAPEGVAENASPVAGLEPAVQTVAQELSREPDAEGGSESATMPGEFEAAIETLVNVALDADDPVAALGEGADALAEALAARDAASEELVRTAWEQQADLQGAYRHARLHRVAELMDVGYSLDQAVAITNVNEAQIGARAVAAGRNPMEPIYQYALLNGYRATERGRPDAEARGHSAPVSLRNSGRKASTMEALVQLTDEAFAEATRGDLWERLMRR